MISTITWLNRPFILQTNHKIDWDSAKCILPTVQITQFQRLTLESWFNNLQQTPLNRLIDNINRTDKQWTILLTIDQLDQQKTDQNATTESLFTVLQSQLITSRLTDKRPLNNISTSLTNQVNNQRHLYHPLTFHNLLDSENDFRSGFRNVSQCPLKGPEQSFSGLQSPG